MVAEAHRAKVVTQLLLGVGIEPTACWSQVQQPKSFSNFIKYIWSNAIPFARFAQRGQSRVFEFWKF